VLAAGRVGLCEALKPGLARGRTLAADECENRRVFRFLLRLEDGEPNDPAVLVRAVPNWTVGETFSTSRGHEWRILEVETDIDEELVERGINAVFTIEPF
jgi:hypothetical protein